MTIDPIDLTQALIRCPSVTPADAGALDVLRRAVEPLGFACQRLRFSEAGTSDIDNLYAGQLVLHLSKQCVWIPDFSLYVPIELV